MQKATLQTIKLEELEEDSENANQGSERGFSMLAESVEKFGAARSLVVDKGGRLVAGNKTLEALLNAGITDAVIVDTDGRTPVIVRRPDWDLRDRNGEARKYAYFDNRVSEVDLSWDVDQLRRDLGDGVDFAGLFSNKELDVLLNTDIEFPDEEPMDEPINDPRTLIEIRCEPGVLRLVKSILVKLEGVDGCEINISG